MATQKLRVEAGTLEDRHRSMTTVLLETDNVWHVAAQYFQPFRHGLALGSRFTKEAATQFSNQLDFVQAAMVPDVVSRSGFGPESIMKSWSFSQWFNDVEVKLEGLHGASSGELTAVPVRHYATCFQTYTTRGNKQHCHFSQIKSLANGSSFAAQRTLRGMKGVAGFRV